MSFINSLIAVGKTLSASLVIIPASIAGGALGGGFFCAFSVAYLNRNDPIPDHVDKFGAKIGFKIGAAIGSVGGFFIGLGLTSKYGQDTYESLEHTNSQVFDQYYNEQYNKNDDL